MRLITGTRDGPTALARIQIAVGAPANEQIEIISALVDTGAEATIIHPAVIEKLGLAATGRLMQVNMVGVSGSAGSAWICMYFRSTDTASSHQIEKEVVVREVGSDCDVILGMDVLQYFDISFHRDLTFSLDWSEPTP